MSDPVNHPAHYGGEDNPYEAIKVIEEWLGPEGAKAFCLGNTIKYISRAGKKSSDAEQQDLKKAAWYLDRAIQGLERNGKEQPVSPPTSLTAVTR